MICYIMHVRLQSTIAILKRVVICYGIVYCITTKCLQFFCLFAVLKIHAAIQKFEAKMHIKTKYYKNSAIVGV